MNNTGIQEQVDALRQAINATQLGVPERQSALELVDEVETQLASGKPKKPVVTALLSGRPKVADIVTIAGTVIALLK